jgi:hypothetical protein
MGRGPLSPPPNPLPQPHTIIGFAKNWKNCRASYARLGWFCFSEKLLHPHTTLIPEPMSHFPEPRLKEAFCGGCLPGNLFG